jgi:hypothetical protein
MLACHPARRGPGSLASSGSMTILGTSEASTKEASCTSLASDLKSARLPRPAESLLSSQAKRH